MPNSGSPNSSKRFFYTLDGIRGMAALLVLLHHAEPLHGLETFRQAYLAVDIFFVLSGVVICNAYEVKLLGQLSVRRFAWIRLVRIYPLYILGSACSVLAVLAGLMPGYAVGEFLTLVALAVLLLPNPAVGTPAQMFPFNLPAWSLFYELVVNVFYSAVARHLNFCFIGAIVVLSAVGLALLLWLLPGHHLDVGFTVRSGAAGLCRVGYSFFAGILVYRLFAFRRIPPTVHESKYMPWAVLLTVPALLTAKPPTTLVPYFDFLAVTLAFPVIVYVALHVEPQGWTQTLCKFFGAISFAVYSLHDPLLRTLAGARERFTGSRFGDYGPGTAILFVIILIPLCWFLHQKYDQPLRRRLLSKWPPQSRSAV